MKEIEKKALSSAIRMLDSIHVKYCIEHPDGHFIGALEAKKPITRSRKEHKYPHGAVTRHVEHYMNNLELGQVITIPVAEFDMDAVQSTACNIARKLHGSGNYTTCRGDTSLELLLLKGKE